jgi:hypothetical protein
VGTDKNNFLFIIYFIANYVIIFFIANYIIIFFIAILYYNLFYF